MTPPRAKDKTDERWRFPRGAGGLSPELVSEVQRGRLFEATCAALADQGGYGRTTVAKIVESAGISTRTLDAPTAGRALLAEHRRTLEPLAAALREGRVEPAAAKQPPLTEEMLLSGLAWRLGVALEDDELLAPLAPALTEFVLVPYLGAGPARR